MKPTDTETLKPQHFKGRSFEIVATRIDPNGEEVASNTPETLGEAHGTIYTFREAEEVLDVLQLTKAGMGMPDAEYRIVETDYQITQPNE